MVFQQYIRLVPRITDSGEVKAFPVRTDTVFETSGRRGFRLLWESVDFGV
jgi:hypothetical protein